MQSNLSQPPVVDASQAPEFLHAPEKTLHRRALGVKGLPLYRVSRHPRVLPESQGPLVCLVSVWNPRAWLLLAPPVQLDDRFRAQIFDDETVTLGCIITSISQQILRGQPRILQQRNKADRVREAGGTYLELKGKLRLGARSDVNLISEPPVITPVLVPLLRPPCVGVRGPSALRIGGEVAAIHRDNPAEVGQVFPQVLNASFQNLFDKGRSVSRVWR